MGKTSPARALGVVAIGLALCVPAPWFPARADHGRRARPEGTTGEPGAPRELPTTTPVVPIAPIAPPAPPRAAETPRAAVRSAFEPAPSSAAALAVLARRPGGVLLGDHAIAFAPWERGGTWSSVSLASGATAAFPAPLRIVPSGTIGAFAHNAWPAGDVLVAHDGSRPLLIGVDGSVVHGEARGDASILGATAFGAQVIVWWRLGATRTELEALDVASARPLWRHAGPAWAWDACLSAGGGRVALLSGGEVTVVDAARGTSIGRFSLGALLSGIGWPHALALGGGSLVAAAPGGVVLVDPASGGQRAVATGLAGLPSIVVADDRTAFAMQGEDLVALELATGTPSWAVRVAHARSLHVVSSSHLVVCDADGGAIVIDRASGAAQLRVGVGGCDDARGRSDGSIAIAGARSTWIVGPLGAAAPARAQVVDGVVTLDGAPAAGLPVLVGVTGYPIDGAEGCPPLPAYARCVLTDRAGRFRTVVHARGILPITVDLDAAAHRAARPRAVGGSTEVDLDAAQPRGLRLEVTGADEQL